jgi:hypothetical protein
MEWPNAIGQMLWTVPPTTKDGVRIKNQNPEVEGITT